MKTAIFALTGRGLATALRLEHEAGLDATIWAPEQVLGRAGELSDHAELCMATGADSAGPIGPACRIEAFSRLGAVVPRVWTDCRLLIFVMAAGIVVRQLAPLLRSKDQDPAVLVLDEEGRFVISLLSGHLGGANAWAASVASALGATAVITTATDNRGLIAPDEYARRLGYRVAILSALPALNSKLLRQGSLSYWSAYELAPGHPLAGDSGYVRVAAAADADFVISAFPAAAGGRVCLIPPVLSVGIGCRRGVARHEVLAAVDLALDKLGADIHAVQSICSIDLKWQERGLREAAAALGVPLRTFAAAAIQEANEREKLVPSAWVKEKIGVDGVCEAASLLGTKGGSLLLPKQICGRVTVAISSERFLSSALAREIGLT